jgi:hypothetical protein
MGLLSKNDRCAATASLAGNLSASVGNEDEEGTGNVAGAPKIPDGPRLTLRQRRFA